MNRHILKDIVMWFGLIPHKEVDIMILSVGMSIRTSQTSESLVYPVCEEK